jgi:hypothetical protein
MPLNLEATVGFARPGPEQGYDIQPDDPKGRYSLQKPGPGNPRMRVLQDRGAAMRHHIRQAGWEYVSAWHLAPPDGAFEDRRSEGRGTIELSRSAGRNGRLCSFDNPNGWEHPPTKW